MLTDWTTVAGVDGSGLLALVTGAATAEGIHLATLGYEVFVTHPDATSVDDAEAPSHVHHVVAPDVLPEAWPGRFDLVVALDGAPPVAAVAPQGLVLVVADEATELDGLRVLATEEVRELGEVRTRTVLARLD